MDSYNDHNDHNAGKAYKNSQMLPLHFYVYEFVFILHFYLSLFKFLCCAHYISRYVTPVCLCLPLMLRRLSALTAASRTRCPPLLPLSLTHRIHFWQYHISYICTQACNIVWLSVVETNSRHSHPVVALIWRSPKVGTPSLFSSNLFRFILSWFSSCYNNNNFYNLIVSFLIELEISQSVANWTPKLFVLYYYCARFGGNKFYRWWYACADK